MEEDSNENQSFKSKIESTISNITGAGGAGNESNTGAEPDNSRLNLYSAFFNGLGVGLLLGLLLGLAVSPVVSAIIGTLSSLLVVLLGLNENYLNAVKSIRIGAFGLFCVIGILMGTYLRNNNSFAPSLDNFYTQYTEIGFSDTDARAIIAYQKFRLIPKDFNFTLAQGADSLANQTFQSSRTVLFSSEINAAQCYILNSCKIDWDYADIENNFQQADGTWKELVDNLDASLPELTRAKTLLLLRDVFCGSGEAGTFKISCGNFQNNSESNLPVEKVKISLAETDPLWKQIVSEIDKQIEPEHHEKLYYSLINILCHD